MENHKLAGGKELRGSVSAWFLADLANLLTVPVPQEPADEHNEDTSGATEVIH